MKRIPVVIQILFAAGLLVQSGCEPGDPEPPVLTDAKLNPLQAYTTVKIRITPLTEFAAGDDDDEDMTLRIYVSLLDSFDSRIKGPAVFRFELYEYVQRSAVTKGRRLMIWPDFDLKDAAENNRFWRDFLRAYEFELTLDQARDQQYVLEATAICPPGKRLLTEFRINSP